MCDAPNREVILAGLQQQMPVGISESLDLRGKIVGLVIVDVVNGFCKFGNLAPPAPDPVVSEMINCIDEYAQIFTRNGLPVLIFRDTHELDKPEPPYPPHCIEGTGEEELVDELKWLITPSTEGLSSVTVINKNCIDGYIGGLIGLHDLVKDWVEFEGIEVIVVVGLCTDICDLQFTQTMLSARNHGLLGNLQDVVILVPACTTYDLPLEVTSAIGLPNTAAHPRDLAQHIGLYLMQGGGAKLTNNIVLD